MSNKKAWFMTGAGRGMGLDFAKTVLDAGHAVVHGSASRTTRSDFQPIAERVHGEQMTRLARLLFGLLPQLYHQLTESAGAAVLIDAPDFVQKCFAGNGVAAFAK